MSDRMTLVGFAGSRNLQPKWYTLIEKVVSAVAKAGRGIAVGCARGADELVIRACFADSTKLQVPCLRIFAAFGPDGKGVWKYSATKLVQWVARLAIKYNEEGKEPRIIVHWWVGGREGTELIPRLKLRTKRMVEAVVGSGQGRGLIAFVAGGPCRSPGTWGAIRLAHEQGLPIIVFACGCSVRDFPSLGEGHWRNAGRGMWELAWMWEEDTLTLGEAIREGAFGLLNWQPARPGRRKVELDLPLMLNIRHWLWQSTRQE